MAMSLFRLRKSQGSRALELPMAGLKLGTNVLQVRGQDTGLIAALAKIVGLSGQACAVAETEHSAKRFKKSAAEAGVLVEVKVAPVSSLPYENNCFDLVVIKHVLGELTQNERVLCLQEALRVIRVGGRCLVIDPETRGGLGAIFSRQSIDPRYLDGGAQQALTHEGFRAVRILGERGGLKFTEGTKAGSD